MKTLLLFSLFLVFATKGFPQYQEKIIKLIEKGDLEKAEKLCVEEEKSYSYDCYEMIADAYLHLGDVKNAEARYKLSGHYKKGMEKIGDEYFRDNDLINASEYYEKAGNWKGFNKIADSYFNKGDLSNAVIYYRKGLSDYNLNKIANIYLEKNDLANAAKLFNESGSKFDFIKLADAYFQINDYSNALIYYEKSNNEPGIKKIAGIYLEKGYYDSAAVIYEKIDDYFGIKRIAEAYIAKKEYVKAKVCFEKINLLLDTRDNKTYRTIKIGDKWIMAENLAYKPAKGNYWAYDNNDLNIDDYGYLYDWETAKASIISGWHIPSAEEWKAFQKYFESNGDPEKIIEALHGGSEFNAIGGGCRLEKGIFIGLEVQNEFWSSTPLDASFAYTFTLNSFKNFVGISNFKKNTGLSIRLIKD